MTAKLILVNGLPASGKTTLARWLGVQLNLPVIHKDNLKEILFDTLGYSDRVWSMKLGAASMELLYHVIETQVRTGQSTIAEANFQAEFGTTRLSNLQKQTGVRLIQIMCQANAKVRLQRFQTRPRHPGHVDQLTSDDALPFWQSQVLVPLELVGPTIVVDTTVVDSINYSDLLRQIQVELRG